MSKKLLENIKPGMTWTSYIGGVYGALQGAGFWKDEVWKLMGMTGMAFHFIVHETCCPSSVTVYDWMSEHNSMMDRIGVHSDFYQTYYDSRSSTFTLKQQDAVRRIKESIDRGICVVVWAPTWILEFGIIYGYDDEDEVFYVLDCGGCEADPILYQNLGKSEVPILAYQIFKSRVNVDDERIYRDSLSFAIGEWEKEFHISPSYASGKKGYTYLIKALENGSFDTFGLAYIIAVYYDSKTCIMRYLDFLSQNSGLKGLDKAVSLYSQISGKYKVMSELFPFSGENGSGCKADRGNASAVLKLARECLELETEAMAIISASLK
jgi:hypothetical protein